MLHLNRCKAVSPATLPQRGNRQGAPTLDLLCKSVPCYDLPVMHQRMHRADVAFPGKTRHGFLLNACRVVPAVLKCGCARTRWALPDD